MAGMAGTAPTALCCPPLKLNCTRWWGYFFMNIECGCRMLLKPNIFLTRFLEFTVDPRLQV